MFTQIRTGLGKFFQWVTNIVTPKKPEVEPVLEGPPTKPPESQPPIDEKPREPITFLQGEIVFFLRHREDLRTDSPGAINELVKLLYDDLTTNDRPNLNPAVDIIRDSLKNLLENALTPATPRPRAVTLQIPAEQNSTQFPEYITTLYHKIEKAAVTDVQLGEAINSLNSSVSLGKIDFSNLVPDSQRLQLLGASRNWIGGSTPGGGGTIGGPGSIPIPITQQQAIDDLDQEYQRLVSGELEIAQLKVANLLQDVKIQAENESSRDQIQVEIVILDTIPPLPQLAAQFQKFVLNPPAGIPTNPVMRDFFGDSSDFKGFNATLNGDYLTVTPNGLPENRNVQFRFSYNLMRYGDTRLLMDFLNDEKDGIELIQHPHKMADHGLFVASTIRDYITRFDPNMKVGIHLIQVLSDYGVGTLESLAQGLSSAFNDRITPRSIPLVINCSLMLAASREADAVRSLEPLDKLINNLKMQTNRGEPNSGVNIVAAAGNEGMPTVSRPAARFPAAFKMVLGVGSSRWNGFNYTGYSNQPDDPPSEGAKLPGGEARFEERLKLKSWIAQDKKGEEGVSGVYIGEFPQLEWQDGRTTRDENRYGWARWAGTSFAAPRATALLAILRAQGYSAEEAKEKINIRQ